MKILNKTVAIFLAVLMAFSANIISFAEDDTTGETDASTTETAPESIKIKLIYDENDNTKNNEIDVEKSKVVNDDGEIKEDVIKAYLNKNCLNDYPVKYEQIENTLMHKKTTYSWDLQPKSTEEDGKEETIEPEDNTDGEVSKNDSDGENESNETLGSNEDKGDDTQKKKPDYVFVLKSSESEEECEFNINKILATCEEAAKLQNICEHCKNTYEKEVGEPLGHKWDEGVVTTEPTEDNEGVKTLTCSVCQQTMTEAIPPLAHTHTPGEAQRENVVDSTCEKEGSYNEVVHCTKCGEIISTEAKTIAKKDHNPGKAKPEDVVDPTCTTAGSCKEVTRCTVCNEQIGEAVPKTMPATGHTWVSKSEKGLEPKNGKNGYYYEVEYCSKCDYINNKKKITIKYLAPQIVLEDTKKTKPIHFVEKFDSKTTSTRELHLKSKVKYTYQILLKNVKIELSPEAKKVCTLTNKPKAQNWKGRPAEKTVKSLKDSDYKASETEGTFEIKPIKEFNKNKKTSDYYVTVSGKANGKTYKLKIYLYGLVSLAPTIKSAAVVCGSSSKQKVEFMGTYNDKKVSYYYKTFALDTKSVGQKSVSHTVNGITSKYKYYVKCKVPTLKASSAKKAVNLSWKKVGGATGYKIYRSTSKNKGYQCVKTINSAKTLKYKDTKLKSKKTYYYKIVAVYSKNTKCNSNYSSVKSCKTK